MLHIGERVPGRPPKSTMTEPVVDFRSSSHLYAKKESCSVTKIFAYTSLVDGVYGDPREVTHLKTKAIRGKVHNMGVSLNVAACPWTTGFPYEVSDWSNSHVRIDCHSDFGFWCQLPKNMLPAVHTAKRVELEHNAKRAQRAKRAEPAKPVAPNKRVKHVAESQPAFVERVEVSLPSLRMERYKPAAPRKRVKPVAPAEPAPVERVKRVVRAKPVKPVKR